MTLKISVRDYRGLERADIELNPLCLIAGQNEAGKSCLAQAVRAVLAGVAIPIPGVAKKDTKLLVRDGADEGRAVAIAGKEQRTVRWPKASVDTVCEEGHEAGGTWCSQFAVGLKHLLDLDDKERANVLAGYIDSAPSQADLMASMIDAGYSESSAERTWKSIAGPDGWDGTYKKAREYTATLKGQWEGVTGEKYGSKKAESWFPDNWPSEDAMVREDLAKMIEKKQSKLERVIGQQAVGKAELDRLKELAAQEPAAEKAIKAAEKKIAKLEKDYAKLADEVDTAVKEEEEAIRAVEALPQPGQAENTVPCPACKADLVVVSKTEIRLPLPAPSGEENFDRQRAIDEAEEAANRATDARKLAQEKAQAADADVKAARAELDQHQRNLESAQEAAQKLDQAQTDGASEEDVQAARDALSEAQQALAAFDAKAKADTIHTNIGKNDKLIAILAPDGLRRRKLAAGLEAFNDALAELCRAAKWPVVRIDENLQAHYGTRPVWAASASGQWRARVVIQVAMAQMDGSAAVVIDEADILDARGRNDLFKMMGSLTTPLRALICMTISKPSLVPDLEQAGLGTSYWVSAGIVETITETKRDAA